MPQLAVVLVAILVWTSPVFGQGAVPATLDEARLGQVGPAVREVFQRYVLFNLPRAFALSRVDGKFGVYGAGGSAEAVRRRALAACAEAGGRACAIVAEDLAVGGVAPAPAPTGPLLQGEGWAFVPDPHFIWWGPGRARGVYVFAHGTGHFVDARGSQPPMHVRAFNNAGFDVVRFDREPFADQWKDRMADRLRRGLRALRGQGWRMVVCGGQSRGAWNCLQTLDTAGAADVVIAVAAASHGTDEDSQMMAGKAELHRMFAGAAVRARVALVQFSGDPFERDPERRMALAREVLAPRVGGVLLIDRPAGLSGHGAGHSAQFALDFGACLLRFATAPVAPGGC